MKTLKSILPVLVTALVLIAIALALAVLNFSQQVTISPLKLETNIRSFEDCTAAGYPILESYPERCMTQDGRLFTRTVGNELDYVEQIQVENPRPGTIVRSPLTISGVARGTWYFEASFPVHVIDGNGEVLTAVPAQAQGDWMTEDFVPFSAELVFHAQTPTGTIVFVKDNPSGLPEFDAQVEIPVHFTTGTEE